MRIVITADGGSPVVIGDDAEGEYIAAALPDQTRRGQVNEALRADFAPTLDRKNARNVLPVTVNRVHDSVDDAVRFKMFHANDVPNVGLVEISDRDLFTLYWADAFVSRVKCEAHNGLTTVFSYIIEGGEITETPTT